MKINKTTLELLEKLSRLESSNSDKEKMFSDFKKILKFVEKLNEIDTKKIEPLIHIHQESNTYREDKCTHVNIKHAILENSPNNNSDYIKVPKVIKK